MKKAAYLLLALLSCLKLSAQKGPRIIVEPGQTLDKEITVVNGDIHVLGKVTQSIYTIGGKLEIGGEVSADVICLGTKVAILQNAIIGRDLIVVGGSLVKSDSSRIGGKFFFIRNKKDLKQILQYFVPFLPDSDSLSFFKVTKIVLWLILSLIVLAIFPGRIVQAAELLRFHAGRTIGIGLISIFVFLLALIAFTILSFILIGLPLLLALILFYFSAQIFGRTTVYYLLGNRLSAVLNIKKATPTAFLLIGVLCYVAIKFIPPLLSIPLLIGLDVLAIGSGVGYFLRKRLYK